MGYVLSAKIVIPHQSCHNKVFEKYSPEWGIYTIDKFELSITRIDGSPIREFVSMYHNLITLIWQLILDTQKSGVSDRL